MLGSEAFLDSDNLTNLEHLLEHGLCKSDVVIVLLTKNVLRRPYVLLEIFEAVESGIPILPLSVNAVEARFAFDHAEASRLLSNLREARAAHESRTSRMQ